MLGFYWFDFQQIYQLIVLHDWLPGFMRAQI